MRDVAGARKVGKTRQPVEFEEETNEEVRGQDVGTRYVIRIKGSAVVGSMVRIEQYGKPGQNSTYDKAVFNETKNRARQRDIVTVISVRS